MIAAGALIAVAAMLVQIATKPDHPFRPALDRLGRMLRALTRR
jgi:hypothetical protein